MDINAPIGNPLTPKKNSIAILSSSTFSMESPIDPQQTLVQTMEPPFKDSFMQYWGLFSNYYLALNAAFLAVAVAFWIHIQDKLKPSAEDPGPQYEILWTISYLSIFVTAGACVYIILMIQYVWMGIIKSARGAGEEDVFGCNLVKPLCLMWTTCGVSIVFVELLLYLHLQESNAHVKKNVFIGVVMLAILMLLLLMPMFEFRKFYRRWR